MLWNAGIMAEFAIFICSGKVKIIVPAVFSIHKIDESLMKIVRKPSIKPNDQLKLLKRGSVPVVVSAL